MSIQAVVRNIQVQIYIRMKKKEWQEWLETHQLKGQAAMAAYQGINIKLNYRGIIDAALVAMANC